MLPRSIRWGALLAMSERSKAPEGGFGARSSGDIDERGPDIGGIRRKPGSKWASRLREAIMIGRNDD
jgi:hypothetical protein